MGNILGKLTRDKGSVNFEVGEREVKTQMERSYPLPSIAGAQKGSKIRLRKSPIDGNLNSFLN